MASGVTPLLITVSEARDVPFRADPFVVVEAGGARVQTDVLRETVAPVWDAMFTLRAVFGPGAREVLTILAWHEDVFEDQLLGRATIDISHVVGRRQPHEEWVMLLDERGLRETGMELLVRVENGKAPPLAELCASEDVTLAELERTISQDPAQCDEREVDPRTGTLCLHRLLANQAMTDAMLALLLKCNHKQARVADRHGNLPLHCLCKRYGATEPALALMIKCYVEAAKAPNKYGKLPLHFLARNPSLTRASLALLVDAYPAATAARDASGSLPLHYAAGNRVMTKELLQAVLAACGDDGSRAAAETPDKCGNVPLRRLVGSSAFTDQHLRVMLRANDRAVQVKDRYGNGPLEYLGWNRETTRFQRTVADEARLAIDRSDNVHQSLDAVGRVREGQQGLRLLMGVQKYSLWFNDFSLAEARQLVSGAFGMRMLVSHFHKGDVLMRRGEAATFFAVLVDGELGIRLAQSEGGGFPRRLHKGTLFGERGLFDAGIRAADVVALTDGHAATLLYSELELLGDAYPELMRKLNLQLAKAAIEEQLGATGMSLDDLGDAELQRQVKEMLKRQQRGAWGAQHKSLLALREGVYAELLDESGHLTADDSPQAGGKRGGKGGTQGGTVLGKAKGMLARAPTVKGKR